MSQNTNELVQKLQTLVAFDTVSGHDQSMRDCFVYLNNFLKEYGLHTELLESGGLPSVVATTQGTNKPKLLLQAHLDVVPAKPAAFEMRQKDGKLHGRGVYDMKFAAACYLQLVQDLKDELGMYDFGLMLTSDEEVGGQNGVGYLLDEDYSADVCFLPDGGDEWQIEASCNGVWMIGVTAKGKTAHGSRPWEGENAITKLVQALDEIRGLFGELKPSQSSITLSQISGGCAINQVPDYAEATIDMRFKSEEETETYQRAVRQILNNRGLELNIIAESQCGLLDLQNQHVIDFMMVAERLHGQPLQKDHSLGATDARFFAAHQIPVIIMRPRGGGHHSDDEWLDKNSFVEFYELVKTYVTETAKMA